MLLVFSVLLVMMAALWRRSIVRNFHSNRQSAGSHGRMSRRCIQIYTVLVSAMYELPLPSMITLSACQIKMMVFLGGLHCLHYHFKRI